MVCHGWELWELHVCSGCMDVYNESWSRALKAGMNHNEPCGTCGGCMKWFSA